MALQVASCERHTRTGSKETVPCPRLVADYHRWIGGVDIRDQLRLQRYSLQLSLRFTKYCKSIFVGLVDIAIVNCFVHRIVMKKAGAEPMTHQQFFRVLHEQLMTVEEKHMGPAIDDPPTSTSARDHARAHAPKENPDYQVTQSQKKRRQRAWKVCSLLHKAGQTRKNTKFFCERGWRSSTVPVCKRAPS
ncbi:TPA: hypothetical protein N0F65_010249 [Lagenidium giganteum]|uniref:PiggyBac transposable element-derived protein domain-containing protein n=1 Tax=Lagenidium giganteum TaxID=4803 RepID=A0AAV2YYD8_9STRA|nr:TPA: hypothetical protein N0F65_010249 [Lagenidium giganteum]